MKKKVESKALRLAFKGYEISEYDYQYVHRQDDSTFIPKISKRTAKKDVVKVEFKLEESNHGFSEGCYSYPFQYQLPHNIPGIYACCDCMIITLMQEHESLDNCMRSRIPCLCTCRLIQRTA